MSATSLAFCVFITVLIGSTMQRIAGMGLGLLAGSVLSILMGPIEGILVVNLLALINACLSTYSMRRNVEWKRFALIGSVMIVGALPAVYLLHLVSTRVLQILVGSLLLLALGSVVFLKNYIPPVTGKFPAMASGVLGGFMNTLAGVAGPAITVYAQAARWEQRSFAATLQPLFIVSGLVSFLVKEITGVGNIDGIPWAVWPAGVAGMLIAMELGKRLATRVPRDKARNLAIGLAAAGALSVLLRGLLTG